MKNKSMWWGSILVITLLTSGYTQEAEAPAATYDAAAEFSATNNPNGVWSYGWSTALGSPFNLGVGFVRDGLDGWGGFIAGDGNPSVLHNGTFSTIMLAGILPVPPGALLVHPGPDDQKQIVRWTAPAAGGYFVAATFTCVHSGGTDVHVLRNGSSIFDGAVNQTTNVASFSATLVSVNAGDTIDFAVGFGSDGVFFGDSTTLTAVIWTPAQAIQNLITTIGNMGLPRGVATSLIAPLSNINTNNKAGACGKLNAFINQVNAKAQNGQLTPAQANQLLQAANAIKACLGC